MADFRDAFDSIEKAGFSLAAISVDPPQATALLQSELYLPFDMLCDTDRAVTASWGVLNAEQRNGIPVPALFAVGAGCKVLASVLDSMTRQTGPAEFLATIDKPDSEPVRRLVFPRLLQFFRMSRTFRNQGHG